MKIGGPQLIKLENDLNGIAFRGIPVGSTIATHLYIEFLMENGSWGLKDRIIDFIRFFNLKHRGVSSSRKGKKRYSENPDQYKNKGLLTFISSRPHLFKMNYFIWKNYRTEELLCFLENDSLTSVFDREDQPLYITKNHLPLIDLKAWRQSFRKLREPLGRIIKTFLRENDLPTYVERRLLNVLMVQTQYLVAFDQLLKVLHPKFVLVEHDRYDWCVCLILAAKKLGVPTFTMMHGVVNNRFGYLPLLADFLFCWGERQKKLLEKYGGNPKHLIITGATQLNPSIKISKQTVRKKLRVADGKKVVLLATNPVKPKLREVLIQIFCETVEQNEDIVGVVRLHPSEDIAFYAEFMKKYPKIIFDKNCRVTFEESFALADIVCIYNSAYGLDAALKGLPVMVINVDSQNLGQAEDFIEHGDFPVAKNTSELTEKLSDYLKNADYRHQAGANVKMYVQQYCKAFEKKAAHNIINYIKAMVELDGHDVESKSGGAYVE